MVALAYSQTTPVFYIVGDNGGEIGRLRATITYPIQIYYMQPQVECQTSYGVCLPGSGLHDGKEITLLDPPGS